jgi:hypothetical protein
MSKATKYALIAGMSAVALWFFVSPNNPPAGLETVSAKTVTVYKSPTCGCCVNYIAMLRQEGYDVDVVETNDMATVKDTYNISRNLESCHTSIFGDYVVEGHMPLDVVEKVLSEKPDIEGIALPNMPSGSPGMPGPKREPFTIYSLDGNVFMID